MFDFRFTMYHSRVVYGWDDCYSLDASLPVSLSASLLVCQSPCLLVSLSASLLVSLSSPSTPEGKAINGLIASRVLC